MKEHLVIISIVLNLIGFLSVGIYSHFQLENKVVKIEAMVEIYDAKMKVHISDKINKLKDDLKKQFRKEGIAYRN